MDISKDAEELKRYMAQAEQEYGVEPSESDGPARKQILWRLQSEIKEWLSRVSVAGGRPFRYNVLIHPHTLELQVSVGKEQILVSVLTPRTVRADDPLTSDSKTVEAPFLGGITPILMAAIKRELVNQVHPPTMRLVAFLGLMVLLSAPLQAADLTLDDAVKMALEHNPSLQATLQEVGISQADVVSAGLLDNPQLGATLRFPNQPGFNNSSDFSLTFNFLSLSLRPLRQRLAGVQLHQAEARVAEAVADLRAQVSEAWYDASACEESLKLQQTILVASQGASDLALRQFQAGTLSDLDYQRQKAVTAQDRLDLARAQQSVKLAEARLQMLLGYPAGPMQVASLPPVPAPGQEALPSLEAAALDRRGVVQAARLELEALRQTLSLRQKEGGWGDIRAGLEGGQEVEGVTTIGPTVQFSVPLFNHNQGEVQKVEAQIKQSEQRYSAVQQQVRMEVDTALSELQAARAQLAVYDDEVLPARTRILQEAQLHYNNMLLSVYQLLADRQAEAQAQRQRIEAQRDYWKAAAELERAIGLQTK